MRFFLRLHKRIVLFWVNTILSGTHCFRVKLILLNTCKGIKIEKGTKIVSPIYLPPLCELEIGKNCWIGRDFSIEGAGKVFIGDNCDLAPMVTCVTGTHEIGDIDRRAGKGKNSSIVIGTGSWLGTRVIVLPNKHIDKAVIVGAGSVVTKDLSSNAIYAGNPAKKIRDL